MCDELNGSAKDTYKAYFNGIKTASQEHNTAISQTRRANTPFFPLPSGCTGFVQTASRNHTGAFCQLGRKLVPKSLVCETSCYFP